MNYFDDVGRFHGKFDLPVSHETWAKTGTRYPSIPNDMEINFRMAFLDEEIREFLTGYGEKDLTKMADALVDIVYVTLGTAHYFGLPFDALWKEVQRSNMEKRPWKEGDPIKPRNTSGLEVVKPDGWTPPDIAGVLRHFRGMLALPQLEIEGPCPPYDSMDEYSPGAQTRSDLGEGE